MVSVIQRVTSALVKINGESIACIDTGVLALVAIERGDDEASARRLAKKLLNYRIFPDPNGKMNLNVSAADGEVLLVPQFTLAANTKSGNRASFSTAAAPEEGQRLFALFVEEVKKFHNPISLGRFGADMQIHLINDGPVTFILKT